MLEFAKNEFELSRPQKDGRTLRDHMSAAERASRGRQRYERLHREVPEESAYYWRLYLELRDAARARAPIGYAEIDAFLRLRRLNLEPREVTLLRRLDSAYLEACYSDKG